MTNPTGINYVMNNLRLIGYDPRTFPCLDYEDVWENIQNFLVYPDPLDLIDDFNEDEWFKNEELLVSILLIQHGLFTGNHHFIYAFWLFFLWIILFH